MKKIDEISSTESLLETIRKRPVGDIEIDSNQNIFFQPDAGMLPEPLLHRKKNALSLGVFIGQTSLSVVVAEKGKETPQAIRDYRKISYPPGIALGSPGFTPFLKSCIERFHYPSASLRVWSCVLEEKVEIRYLKIPRVPGDKVAPAVLWTYRKELNPEERGGQNGGTFDEAHSIFDFEIVGEVVENGVEKLEVMAWAAPRKAVDDLKAVFAQAGYRLEGITTPSFSLQNLFRNNVINKDEGGICTVCIGHSFTRISVFWNGNLVLDRQIRMGITSLAPLLAHAGHHLKRENGHGGPLLEEDGHLGMNPQRAEEIMETWALKVAAGEIENPLSPIETAVRRMASHIEWTLAHYTRNVRPEPVTRLVLYGIGGGCRPLVSAVSALTGIKVTDPDSLMGGVSENRFDENDGEFMVALGLALSMNANTPNFLRNYVQRQREEKYRRIEKALVAVFFLVMLCLGGYSWHQQAVLGNLKAEKERVENKLQALAPRVDRELILNMVSRNAHAAKEMRRCVSRYRGLALINEFSRKTPPGIRLTGVSIDLSPVKEGKEKVKAGGRERAGKGSLTLEGRVRAGKKALDSTLAGYMAQLAGSPLVSDVKVRRKSLETVGNKEVLVFKAHLELL